ncbi:MAG: peptidase M14, partial [Glaciecola sp.]
IDLLKQGFSHFVGNVGLITNESDYMVIENPPYWHDDKKVLRGIAPAGFLCKNGELKYALVMGKILSL